MSCTSRLLAVPKHSSLTCSIVQETCGAASQILGIQVRPSDKRLWHVAVQLQASQRVMSHQSRRAVQQRRLFRANRLGTIWCRTHSLGV